MHLGHFRLVFNRFIDIFGNIGNVKKNGNFFSLVCVCVCVCVCLRVNHCDIIRLGVKVDQGLPCVRHYIPRLSGKPLYGPLVVPKRSLSYDHQSGKFAEPVKKILYFEAGVGADRIL